MAEDHARQGFYLDVLQGVFLDLREVAHLGLRKADVVDHLLAQFRITGVDIRCRQAKVFRLPVVEATGVLAHGRIAAQLDVLQYVFDNLAHFGVVVVGLRFADAFFQIPDHVAASEPAGRRREGDKR